MSIDITMPRLSDTMETGTIINWNVKEGDAVAAGDVVADVETDKATMEMQVYDDGTVAKILVPAGQTTEVGSLIAILAEDDEDLADVATASGSNGGGGATAEPAAAAPSTTSEPDIVEQAPETTTPAVPEPGGRLKVSPVARRLADEHGIDVRSLQGSGPNGRVIKKDVLLAIETGRETVAAIPPTATQALATPTGRPSVAGPIVPVRQGAPNATQIVQRDDQLVAVSNMRQVIARRLVESKTTIPHYQVTSTFDMEPLLALRSELNEQLAAQSVKLSVNDFLIRGCAVAMAEHPYFNASWEGENIRLHGNVNIGIAISLPEERGGGLVVATIRDADLKSLRGISAEARHLATKAREKGLAPEELSGSTFTLSNLGMFGVDHFTAIINPPNSAILAVGAAIQKPVVKDGELAVGHVMSGTLSSDHRVIDGAMSAQFLKTLRELIENPATMLV
ncbi:MAG: dihydrolipoamide acetyltransferase family protein [Planctomycetota bacterium]|jgi:pyruvate dehydrogenase E2 component (dihydrolipoamide acetyltransferase)